MKEEIKAAEKRAYARGYRAGKERRSKQIEVERIYAKQQAFRERAFLAALPACIAADSWKTGDKQPITSLPQRVSLAWRFADEAMKRL